VSIIRWVRPAKRRSSAAPSEDESRRGHDATADRRSQSAADDTATDVVRQRRHREFVPLEIVVLLQALVPDTEALIEFREKACL
jgi:hypothetical protein